MIKNGGRGGQRFSSRWETSPFLRHLNFRRTKNDNGREQYVRKEVGGDWVIMIAVVYLRGFLGVLSLGHFLSVGSYSKPSRYYLNPYLRYQFVNVF